MRELWRVAALALLLMLASSLPAAPRRTIAFLGDSLTAGYGLEPAEAYPAVIERRIRAAGLEWDVINAGISGDTTSGGLARTGWLLRRPVDVLVLALGANDGLRGIAPAETRRNLVAIIERVREKNPAVKIVLCGMQLPLNMGGGFTGEFRALFPEIAKEQKTALVPFLLEGVGGDDKLNQSDRIHPTAAGQEILADNVWKVLEPMLQNAN